MIPNSAWDRFQADDPYQPPCCDECEAEKCFKGCPLDILEQKNEALRQKDEAEWISGMMEAEDPALDIESSQEEHERYNRRLGL